MTAKFAELLPYWFYLAGSLCFVAGTALVIARALRAA